MLKKSITTLAEDIRSHWQLKDLRYNSIGTLITDWIENNDESFDFAIEDYKGCLGADWTMSISLFIEKY